MGNGNGDNGNSGILLNKILAELQAQTRAREGRPGSDRGGEGGVGRDRLLTSDVTMAAEEYEATIKSIQDEINELEAGMSGLFESTNKYYQMADLRARQQQEEHKKTIALLKEKKKVEGGLTELEEKTLAAAENLIEAGNRRRRGLKAESAAANQLGKSLQKAFGVTMKAGGISDVVTKLGQDLMATKAAGGSMVGAITQGFKSFGLAAVMKPVSMLIEQTFGLALAQDKAISAFRKATGASKQYNLEITQLERRHFAAAVTAEDAGKAFQALFEGFSAFTQLSAGEREVLLDTTALLNEMGVSGQQTAKIFDQAFRGMGLSSTGAEALIRDLVGSAATLGVSMKKMTADFSASFGELSKYGDGAIDVFKGLAVQSKNTGLEVGKLIGIAKQFDTFDSAGKAVGRLNAILGGPYLNSIDMLNASEEERIDILKRQVDMAGVQFDALNRFEQQAMASALNMSVEEANRLFRMSEEQYQLEAMQKEEMAERAAEVQDIMTQIKSAFAALAIDSRPFIEDVLVPFIKNLRQGANAVGTWLNKTTAFIKTGMIAAGLALLIAAPFTAGMSLPAGIALLTAAGVGGWLIGGFSGQAMANKTSFFDNPGGAGASASTGKSATATASSLAGYSNGGRIQERMAAVHPGEIIITGGQGSEVLSKDKFEELIAAVKEMGNTSVYVGSEEVAAQVLKNTSPFAMV